MEKTRERFVNALWTLLRIYDLIFFASAILFFVDSFTFLTLFDTILECILEALGASSKGTSSDIRGAAVATASREPFQIVKGAGPSRARTDYPV